MRQTERPTVRRMSCGARKGAPAPPPPPDVGADGGGATLSDRCDSALTSTYISASSVSSGTDMVPRRRRKFPASLLMQVLTYPPLTSPWTVMRLPMISFGSSASPASASPRAMKRPARRAPRAEGAARHCAGQAEKASARPRRRRREAATATMVVWGRMATGLTLCGLLGCQNGFAGSWSWRSEVAKASRRGFLYYGTRGLRC